MFLQVYKIMKNLTVEEFLGELEKSNTTIKDLLMNNFEWIESAELTGGAFFGYSVLLFTDNLKFCLSDRTFRDFAVVKGYMVADGDRREFEFFIDGDLRGELWDCAMVYLGRCEMFGKLDNKKLSKPCLFPYRKGYVEIINDRNSRM